MDVAWRRTRAPGKHRTPGLRAATEPATRPGPISRRPAPRSPTPQRPAQACGTVARVESETSRASPRDRAERAHLRRGVDHFNRGEYFEAHEAWEAAWLGTSGPLAEFYKGLVQCAAALHHVRRRNLVGARRLHDRQRLRLAAFSPRMLGVPVARLLGDMDELFASLASDPRADSAPRAMPVIELDEVAPDGDGGGPLVAGSSG